MVSKILVFALIVGTAKAATWMTGLQNKPVELTHIEGCFIEESNEVMPFGTTATPLGKCVSIYCTPTLLHYASCGVAYPSSGNCFLTGEDVNRRYPACCPTIKCV